MTMNIQYILRDREVCKRVRKVVVYRKSPSQTNCWDTCKHRRETRLAALALLLGVLVICGTNTDGLAASWSLYRVFCTLQCLAWNDAIDVYSKRTRIRVCITTAVRTRTGENRLECRLDIWGVQRRCLYEWQSILSCKDEDDISKRVRRTWGELG